MEDHIPAWIATDDPFVDGAVEVCSVRDEQGIDGIRITLNEGELDAFEAFYDALPDSPVFRVLHREPGQIVFADGEEAPEDARRFGIEAFDALQRVAPHLKGLDASEIRVSSTGGLQLAPRFRTQPGEVPERALGHYLQEFNRGDERLTRAIEALLDSAPEIRRTARAHLVGTRPTTNAKRTGEVKLTTVPTTAPVRAQLDRAPPKAAVILEPATLQSMTPSQRSAAAGRAGVPLAVIDGLIAGGLPLVLETHSRSRDARFSADRLRRELALPARSVHGGSIVSLAWAASLFATAVATGLAAFSLSLLGIFWLPLFGFLAAGGLAVMGAQTGWTFLGDRRLLLDARDALQEADEEQGRRLSHPALARSWRLLADVRASLARANLPTSAAADVRDVLKTAERDLDDLSRAWSTVRAPADVDALANQRAEIASRSDEIERTLSEVARSIARWEAAVGDEAALDDLVGLARHAAKRRLQ